MGNNVYIKLLNLCLTQGSCIFVTSDFPSENLRTQKRNFTYTKPLQIIVRKRIAERSCFQ